MSEEIVLEASSIAKNTFNPIRSLVDRIKVVPNPEKQLISLSLGTERNVDHVSFNIYDEIGDPTIFGNLNTSCAVKDAIKTVIVDGKANGYVSSVGSEAARTAIANRYKTRFSVSCNPEVSRTDNTKRKIRFL
jgi:tyrosine aminotransferase